MRIPKSLFNRIFLFSLAVTFIAVSIYIFEPGRAAGGKHKLRVRDGRLTNELLSRGGRLIADYGSYQMIEVETSAGLALAHRRGAELRDRENRILLNAGAIDTASVESKARQNTPLARGDGGKRLHLVQFAGPVKPEWREALVNAGVQIVNYIPHNAYLVYGDVGKLNGLKSWAMHAGHVQWDGAYEAQFKIAPSAAAISTDQNEVLVGIQLIADRTANPATLDLIDRLKSAAVRHQFRAGDFVNLVVALPQSVLGLLAERSDLISIMRYNIPKRFDERQDMIVAGNLSGALPAPGNYLEFLASQGFTQEQFTASGFAVNISDTGIDNATAAPNHFALYVGGNRSNASRVIYNRLVGTSSGEGSTMKGCDGHGNLNAHIIAGYVPAGAPFNAYPHVDAAGFRYGLGIAPFVRIGSSVIFDSTRNPFGDYTYPNFEELESSAYHNGSRISSNSWGSSSAGEYSFDSQAFDSLVRDSQPAGAPFASQGNQENVILFAAGNTGPNAQSVGAPGTAKNVITVGASESVQTFGGVDSCTSTDDDADNANDMALFSSRGPTQDGRNKPDIVAPGTHITGGVFQIPNPGANGEADPCFDARALCGGPVASPRFFPEGQQFYTASSGTSHSTPVVAGAAALLRQRFLNTGLAAPSPAMTKAVLLNSARYLAGAGVNDTLWSNVQGMGAVDLASAFGRFSTPTLLRDQSPDDLLTASGQMRAFTGTISDWSKPLRVTLAWTDAPGSTAGNAYVNNLDLEVTIGGQTYKGNVFDGAFSTAGGAFDEKNNVESVFIPAGVSGGFTIRVTATNIAGDGLPGNASTLDQDFALVVFNMTEGVAPVVNAVGGVLTNETCLPANNAIDPEETVTVDLTLQNTGRMATGDLIATLLATGGVNAPSAPQSYGAIAAEGGTATRSFRFRASGACGGTLTASLQLQDGGENLGTATFNFTLGTTVLTTRSFTKSSTINIPASGVAGPYPSTINVSGMAGVTTRVKVTLNNLSHTNPADLDLLLVSPGGQKVLLMSDCGGANDLTGVNLTFDDGAPALPNMTRIASGTYCPTNYGIGEAFPGPAPGGTFSESPRMSLFNGANPNGDWSLYVYDDRSGNRGNIANGWSLNLTMTAPFCCNEAAACALTVHPAIIAAGTMGAAYSQTFTQTGGAGSVSFSLTGALPAGLSFANATLAGTPTEAGNFPITVTATDSTGCTGSRAYTLVIPLPTGQPRAKTGDFDGDGKTDLGLWRGSNGDWSILLSSNDALMTFNWGIGSAPNNDVPVPGDYDGDRKTDYAVWRPLDGVWYIILSSDGSLLSENLGENGDVPVPADFDGDNRTDLAIWRKSDGRWQIRRSSDGQLQTAHWGAGVAPYNDKPVPADYDGDGRADLAVWRTSNGTWYIIHSSNLEIRTANWGMGVAPYSDDPVPADYDGDGRADIAVWRPLDGFWFVLRSSNGQMLLIQWGNGAWGDLPVPGDYDGDNKSDAAVWRSSDHAWYVIPSSTYNYFARQHGLTGDTPIPGSPRSIDP